MRIWPSYPWLSLLDGSSLTKLLDRAHRAFYAMVATVGVSASSWLETAILTR